MHYLSSAKPEVMRTMHDSGAENLSTASKSSVLSRLFLVGAAPPIVQIYYYPTPPMRMMAYKADLYSIIITNYYQTVIHMQVHSNQLCNSDARGGQGLDSKLVIWTLPPCIPLFQNSGENTE